MEQIYFSKNNALLLYDILQKKIMRETGYDINGQRSKFGGELTGIMESVYKNRNTFGIPAGSSNIESSKFLSEKVLTTAARYFKDMVNKINPPSLKGPSVNPALTRELDSQISVYNPHISERPKLTSTEFPDTENAFERMRRERDEPKGVSMPVVNFQETNQFVNNDDVSKKFAQLSTLREDIEVVGVVGNEKPKFLESVDTRGKKTVKNDSKSVSGGSGSEVGGVIGGVIGKSVESFFKPLDGETENSLESQFSLLTDVDASKKQLSNQFKVDKISDDDFHKQLQEVMMERKSAGSGSMAGNMGISMTIEPKPVISGLYSEDMKEVEEMEETVNKTVAMAPIETNQNMTSQLVLPNYNELFDKMYQSIISLQNVVERQLKQPLTIRTYNLIISSGDRMVNNTGFNKYNFRVEFAPGGDITNTNYSLNNPGEGNSNYDRTTTTFTSVGERNPHLMRIFRNISSIKLQRIVMPKPYVSNYYSEPYLLVAIDEINSNIYTTKTINKNLFSKVHYDREVSFGTSGAYRTMIHYLNEDDDYQIFYPTPMAKLDRMTLNLLDSNGTLLGSTYSDTDIVLVDGNIGGVITIDSGYLVQNLFIVGDKITFSEYPNYVSRVESINTGTNSIIIDTTNYPLPSGFNLSADSLVVNLTNQIQYVFQVKIEEPDALVPLRADLV